MREAPTFLETAAPIAAGVLIATLLYRFFKVELPLPFDACKTIDEKTVDTLGELNERETREGRRPFTLVRN